MMMMMMMMVTHRLEPLRGLPLFLIAANAFPWWSKAGELSHGQQDVSLSLVPALGEKKSHAEHCFTVTSLKIPSCLKIQGLPPYSPKHSSLECGKLIEFGNYPSWVPHK